MVIKQSRTKFAFTIVELLVVIGIIAILIAMLLPALRRVQDSARTVQCASNLRQAMVALTLYSMDNQGYLPPTTVSASAPFMVGFNIAVIRYCGYRWQILDCPGATDWVFDAAWKATEFTRIVNLDGKAAVPYYRISFAGSIGYNSALAYNSTWVGTGWEKNYPKLAQLRGPKGIIVMGDSKGGDIAGEYPYTSQYNYWLQPASYGPTGVNRGPWQDVWQNQVYPIRHRRRSAKITSTDYNKVGGNMVFADGHAEFMAANQVHGKWDLFKPYPSWPER
jgi:prepilin-type processing-associated H-X9-DG protein